MNRAPAVRGLRGSNLERSSNMKKDKKQDKVQTPDEELELDLDTLEEVSGGTLRNVRFTQTADISNDTINKIGNP